MPPNNSAPPRPGYSLVLFATLLTVILLAGIVASFLPPDLHGPAPAFDAARQSHFIERFFPWDSGWYEATARDGYAWRPALAAQKQTIAFFPLWPILLRVLMVLHLPAALLQWVIVTLTITIAWASIYAFHRLAALCLSPGPARLATAFYAFYPGAIFLLKSYPTGLLNLLTILALTALHRRRDWLAAVLSGVATAAGPLGVAIGGIVAATAIWRARGEGIRAARAWRAAAFVATAFGGLLGFMLFQYAAFGTPTAFITAQQAWGPSLPVADRLLDFAKLNLALPELVLAAKYLAAAPLLWGGLSHAAATLAVQNGLGLAALGVALLALLGARHLPPQFILHGWLTLILYIWFVASMLEGWATLRLIYPAITPFLAAAVLLEARRWLLGMALAGSLILLALQETMISAGYQVI